MSTDGSEKFCKWSTDIAAIKEHRRSELISIMNNTIQKTENLLPQILVNTIYNLFKYSPHIYFPKISHKNYFSLLIFH